MSALNGVVFSRTDPSVRVDVSLEILENYVIMRVPENQWFGSWTISDLQESHLGGARFNLTHQGAKLLFEAKQPDLLLDSLAIEDRPPPPSGWERLTKKLSSFGAGRSISDEPSVNGHSPTVASQNGHATANGQSSGITENLLAHVAEYRLDTIDWLEAAMTSWFDFYFRLTHRSLHDLLFMAASGIEDAGSQLEIVSQQLEAMSSEEGSPDLNSAERKVVAEYAAGVGLWADGLRRISIACRADEQAGAAEGFATLDEGTEVINRMLGRVPQGSPPSALGAALLYLDALVPESEVSSTAVDRAKAPWRRALAAAGWRHEERTPVTSLSHLLKRGQRA